MPDHDDAGRTPVGRAATGVAAEARRLRERGIRPPDEVALATALVIASLAMGRIYGRDVGHFGPLLALLYGGAVSLVGRYDLFDADLFGAVIAGLIGGLVGAFLLPGVLLGTLLDVPVSNVVYVLSIRVIAEVTVASLLVLFGILGVFVVAGVRWGRRDLAGSAVAVAGLTLYAAGDPGVGYLLPVGATAVTTRLETAHRLYPFLDLLPVVGGALVFVGLVPLARSRVRSRRALGAVVAAGLVVGLVAVGNVYAYVGYGHRMSAVESQVGVEDARMTLSEDELALALKVHNPTDRTLVATGGYLRVDTDARPKVAWGGVSVAGARSDRTVPPGETATLTVRLDITDRQFGELSAARDDGRLTVEGPLRLRFGSARTLSDRLMHRRLIVDLRCTATARGTSCRIG